MLFQNNEVVLITGGASGLGRTLVRMFVDEGARVVFTYKKSQEQAESIMKELGEGVFGIYADASDYKAADDVISATLQKFGDLDILVNNAAAAKGGDFLRLAEEDMRYTLDNTFMPVFNYSQAAAKFFSEKQKGVIVQIGSINGERGREGSAPYCAAKAAVEGLSKTIAKELGEFFVRCNVVAPGYIATDGQENTSYLIKKMVLDECAVRKLSSPEEVGNLVLFLASDKAQNITGQIYRIDCGQYI